jgi:hypothetical protein
MSCEGIARGRPGLLITTLTVGAVDRSVLSAGFVIVNATLVLKSTPKLVALNIVELSHRTYPLRHTERFGSHVFNCVVCEPNLKIYGFTAALFEKPFAPRLANQLLYMRSITFLSQRFD